TKDYYTTDDSGYVVKDFQYTYDVYDRRITKSVYSGSHTVVTQFVFDGGRAPGVTNDIVLQLDGNGAPTHRYLYGPAVDQILADERVGGSHDGEVIWALTDNLGTPRDLVRLGDQTVFNHLVYDSFGNVISETRAVIGDMNGDGVTNNFDMGLFEQALSNPSAYEAAYPLVTDWVERADGNHDDAFNNFDISPFESVLTGGQIYVGHAFLIGFTGQQRDE